MSIKDKLIQKISEIYVEDMVVYGIEIAWLLISAIASTMFGYCLGWERGVIIFIGLFGMAVAVVILGLLTAKLIYVVSMKCTKSIDNGRYGK